MQVACCRHGRGRGREGLREGLRAGRPKAGAPEGGAAQRPASLQKGVGWAAHCPLPRAPPTALHIPSLLSASNMQQALQQQRSTAFGGRVGGSRKQTPLSTRAAFRPASAGRRNGRLRVVAEKASARWCWAGLPPRAPPAPLRDRLAGRTIAGGQARSAGVAGQQPPTGVLQPCRRPGGPCGPQRAAMGIVAACKCNALAPAPPSSRGSAPPPTAPPPPPVGAFAASCLLGR